MNCSKAILWYDWISNNILPNRFEPSVSCCVSTSSLAPDIDSALHPDEATSANSQFYQSGNPRRTYWAWNLKQTHSIAGRRSDYIRQLHVLQIVLEFLFFFQHWLYKFLLFTLKFNGGHYWKVPFHHLEIITIVTVYKEKVLIYEFTPGEIMFV